jgi:excinuclease ABC subunit B
VIEAVNRPTLVMAHNKTLAAQLYSEFREFFPHNAVEYFVSYYDYYQPEAYVPRHDLHIEKEVDINEEIERLRLASMASLLSRRDVIIVASVSCIYGTGNPEVWNQAMLKLERGQAIRRNNLLRRLVNLQYERSELDLRRGAFRVRGDALDIQPAYSEQAYRVTMFGDEIERLVEIDPLTGEVLMEMAALDIFPATHFITPEDTIRDAIIDIEQELEERLAWLKSEERMLEAQRLEQRTRYDIEMLREVGFTSGIENYSRHLDRRAPGTPPWTLMDYFPADFLLVVDESHMTLPQVRGMWGGDRSRKQTLVDFGFRLPSALDNRPLNFDEYQERMKQVIYTSATPGPFEMEHGQQVVELIIRPTGVVDPEIHIKPVEGQIDDLVTEIKLRVGRGERTLVTTLTIVMAEKLTDYLLEMGIKVHYLHSQIDTLQRIEILRDLRLGVFDVVVGINLLREGLDLPEVSLVAILDSDRQGFLRSGSALVQTIGRAARHVNGTVLMYADKYTDAMRHAIDETNRRREKQRAYNIEHGIEPASIAKEIRDLTQRVKMVAEEKGEYAVTSTARDLSKSDLNKLVKELEKQMKAAAQNLEFEKAATLRDQIFELREIMLFKDVDSDRIPVWEKDRILAEQDVGYRVPDEAGE